MVHAVRGLIVVQALLICFALCSRSDKRSRWFQEEEKEETEQEAKE